MFVVTVETDEAPSFCAFTRSKPALDWALSRSLDDSGCVVGVYRAPGGSSGVQAVEAVRDGRGRLVMSGDNLRLQYFRERSCVMAGMGIGTGAGF